MCTPSMDSFGEFCFEIYEKGMGTTTKYYSKKRNRLLLPSLHSSYPQHYLVYRQFTFTIHVDSFVHSFYRSFFFTPPFIPFTSFCFHKSTSRFRAKADVLIPSGQFVYGFSAQDTLFNGRFSANIPGRVFAYEKHVGLPNGMNVAVTAGAQYVGARGLPGISFRDHFKPLCGFQLRFGGVSRGDGDVVYSGEGFSVKQRVPLPLGLLGLRYPAVDLETFTTVKIPQMTSRFSVQNDGFGLGAAPQGFGGIGGAVREDNAFCLHVQGINAVIRL